MPVTTRAIVEVKCESLPAAGRLPSSRTMISGTATGTVDRRKALFSIVPPRSSWENRTGIAQDSHTDTKARRRMVHGEFESRLAVLDRFVGALLSSAPQLHDEFHTLYARAVSDPPMAVARARRILEILVVQKFISTKQITPPIKKSLLSLYRMIEELTDQGALSRTMAAVCHAIRLEGNRVLHYLPDTADDPIKVDAVLSKY